MVHRIRIWGHVIRVLGLRPSTSRIPPESCPSCDRFYNDEKHKRCVYLCCEFEDCLDCVLNQNKFYCSKIINNYNKPLRTAAVVNKPEVVTTESDKEVDDDVMGRNLKLYDKTEREVAISQHLANEIYVREPEMHKMTLKKLHYEQNPQPQKLVKEKNSDTETVKKSTTVDMTSTDRSLEALVKRYIPKRHLHPLVRVRPFCVKSFRKYQTSKTEKVASSKKRGRSRKSRKA